MRAAFSTTLGLLLLAAPVAGGQGPVLHFPSATVKDAFDRGAVLLNDGTYMVHASRREAAGQAEVHEFETDIIYVLQGGADFVTGGSVVEGRATGPGELRGAAIAGGEERTLVPGDVVVVPTGTPHWFRAVRAPLLYYVVKVRTASGTPPPAAAIDLTTVEGARLADARWRYRDASIVQVPFRSVGSDLKPSGLPNTTHDIDVRGGGATVDEAHWAEVEPGSLAARRTNGKLAFGWYRVNVRVPERIGEFDPTGSDVVFETVVDDYAEVWVDGDLRRALGLRGGSLVAGWNAPNRLVVARDVRPGQRIQLAIFAINGPLSDPPPNYVWMRSARLAFHRGVPLNDAAEPLEPHVAGATVAARVTRLDPALDAIVPPGVHAEKLAGGFTFTEGPVWSAGGDLLFSDPNENRIYRWTSGSGLSVYRERSGYEGLDIGEYRQPGSNGLAFDPEGRLTVNQHGNRRIVRVEQDGSLTVLADAYGGKRLNSPNDLVYKSDGTLYFTDPPFGLPKVFDDPRKELPFSGVYRVRQGRVDLLSQDLTGPNGLAFSPDEKFLYVGNWDEKKKVVMRYEVKADGSLGKGAIFFDMTGAPGEDAIDGIKVDARGNVYVSGPGGLWILSPEGRHLGTIGLPEHPHNLAWGDDGQTLYLTAQTSLYRIRLNVRGASFPPSTN